MWAPHFRKHRPGVVSLLAVSTALAMIAANTFLALTHNVRMPTHTSSLLQHRFTPASICFTVFFLSWCQAHHLQMHVAPQMLSSGVNCCCE